MKKEDFFNLKVGQEIWYKGINFKIDSLAHSRWSNKNTIRIYGSLDPNKEPDQINYYWDDICADCSLEEPREKRRYWIWLLSGSGCPNPWLTSDVYDDNGYLPNGERNQRWDTFKKKKIESVWWEE